MKFVQMSRVGFRGQHPKCRPKITLEQKSPSHKYIISCLLMWMWNILSGPHILDYIYFEK